MRFKRIEFFLSDDSVPHGDDGGNEGEEVLRVNRSSDADARDVWVGGNAIIDKGRVDHGGKQSPRAQAMTVGELRLRGYFTRIYI